LHSPLRILWLIDFEYSSRLHHGAYIRYFNFAPRLLARGHSVVFAVNFIDSDRQPARKYLEELKAAGIFTDFVETNLEIEPWRLKAGLKLVYPAFSNLFVRPTYQQFASTIDAIAAKTRADIIIISTPRLLFVQRESRARCPFIFDICDSQSLFLVRQIRVLFKQHKWKALLRQFKLLMLAVSREHYYCRAPVLKILASPVDKRSIDKIAGCPESTVVILNGVKEPSPHSFVERVPGRLIFTGNMAFAPNYEAALWFEKAVFPQLLRLYPNAQLVIAGANPIPELLNRASDRVIVTGYVSDILREIASSSIFVAPLISGGGFKNKILEAFITRTYVVGTKIAVEFLDPVLRGLVSVANTPEEMVAAIQHAWEHPDLVKARTESIYNRISNEFGWAGRTEEVIELARRALLQHSTSIS